mmetsp:Transcript_46139/g.147630  ORF Transcript_46139/g.147630 Transcript_46139/m.147630 type:complete len:511 (+) Transcript_46139:1375-2907(+)
MCSTNAPARMQRKQPSRPAPRPPSSANMNTPSASRCARACLRRCGWQGPTSSASRTCSCWSSPASAPAPRALKSRRQSSPTSPSTPSLPGAFPTKTARSPRWTIQSTTGPTPWLSSRPFNRKRTATSQRRPWSQSSGTKGTFRGAGCLTTGRHPTVESPASAATTCSSSSIPTPSTRPAAAPAPRPQGRRSSGTATRGGDTTCAWPVTPSLRSSSAGRWRSTPICPPRSSRVPSLGNPRSERASRSLAVRPSTISTSPPAATPSRSCCAPRPTPGRPQPKSRSAPGRLRLMSRPAARTRGCRTRNLSGTRASRWPSAWRCSVTRTRRSRIRAPGRSVTTRRRSIRRATGQPRISTSGAPRFGSRSSPRSITTRRSAMATTRRARAGAGSTTTTRSSPAFTSGPWRRSLERSTTTRARSNARNGSTDSWPRLPWAALRASEFPRFPSFRAPRPRRGGGRDTGWMDMWYWSDRKFIANLLVTSLSPRHQLQSLALPYELPSPCRRPLARDPG